MATLWMVYKMYLVGTMKLSKKKSRTADDYPYAKLTPGALSLVARGWMRTAVQKFKGYVAMAVLWKAAADHEGESLEPAISITKA